MNGKSPQKRSYEISLNKNAAVILEIFLIMAGGALATFLHQKLRIPLNLPGHHGLEFMAIFVLIRMGSSLKYAATIATLGTGIALLIPGMGAGNPMHSFSYLLPGIMLDMLYRINFVGIPMIILVAFMAGLSYMSIPLSRLLLNLISGYPYMAFIKFGAIYTTLSFFFFGMLGGVLGYGLSKTRSLTPK